MRAGSESPAERRGPRVLHVIPGFYPAVRYGGPIESVLRTCQALLRAGVDLEVLTTDADGPLSLDVPTDRVVDVEGVPVRYCRRWPQASFNPSAPLVRELHAQVPRFDLVHVTAAFSFPSAAACIAARSHGVPYVVSPRGSCRPFALKQKSWKKQPYWWAIERHNLRAASALHATSDAEADELRALLPGQTVWTIPNGVDLPTALPEQVERSRSQVLFLGRLHPVKALDRLVEAMSLVARELPEVELVLAGHDDDGLWALLEKQLATLSPRPRVRYLGVVRGAEKQALIASSTLLVLPSHTENFGQVVVEALAQGTPVIASRHTPWRRLEEAGAGLWVDNDPASLAAALSRMLSAPSLTRDMGERGRELAREYSWSRVADGLLEGYLSVVRATARPVR